MRRTFLLLLATALALAACSGPNPALEDQALFSDDDLLNPQVLSSSVEIDLGASATVPDASGLLSGPPTAVAMLDAASVETLGSSSKSFSTGGFLVYVEQKGKEYRIRLAQLDDDSELGKRGDRVIYKGKKAVQSVAVTGDGSLIAFVAPGYGGKNDIYLLDLHDRTVSSTVTAANEFDVSMSLDGRYLAWQSESRNGNSIVWFDMEYGGVAIDPTVFEAMFGLPLTFVQPSLSGDGLSIAMVETSGNISTLIGYPPLPAVAIMSFDVTPGGMATLGMSVEYLGNVSNPSVSYDANGALFLEEFDGLHYVIHIDRGAGALRGLLIAEVDHPHLTADGEYYTFSFGGDAYVAAVAGGFQILSPSPDKRDTGTYWARGNFTAYEGQTSSGPFVRPDVGDGLSDAHRTVPYHAYEFKPPVSGWYSILSTQDYDGYLLLYKGRFDPSKPATNLVAFNDDFDAAWDGSVGSSRIRADLDRRSTYVIVTTACGALGSPCGPDTGSFANLISPTSAPPPPTDLPEPDDTAFNITLRFWNDSLSADEQLIFEMAAARWSQVITDDVENIEDFVLTDEETTTGAPGIVGVLDDVIIDASKVAIDGPGGVLARAGAFYVRNGGPDHFLPTYGIMEFDEAEFEPGGFYYGNDAALAAVILHEMGHVLGISRAFWIPLGLIEGNRSSAEGCSNVALGDDPRYKGTLGNDAWVNFYQADSAQVPIANENGCGTADSHWREIYLDDEIMTGFAAGGSEPLSRVTIGALADLGYGVDFDAADAWSLPILPSLSQVSPTPTDYELEWDFLSAFTDSKLGLAQAAVTAVDLALTDPATSTSGCEAEDFVGFPAGNIALVQRGTCPFFDKAANALAAGASAVLIGNQGSAPDRMGTFAGTVAPGVDIVAIPISFPLLQELAAIPDLVMRVDTRKDDAITALALPGVEWHLAEEFVPLRGMISSDGTVTPFGSTDD